MREPPIALVFHPVRASSSQCASDAFAAAVKTVLDAAPAEEVCLVSPYLAHSVLVQIVAERSFRLVTDLDECFKARLDDDLVTFLLENIDRVHHRDGVHAKIVLTRMAALVGSANLTVPGLRDRDEMGCLIRDPLHVETLQHWFDDLFNIAAPVRPQHVVTAAEQGRMLAAARTSSGATAGSSNRPVGGGQRTLGWMALRSNLPSAEKIELEPVAHAKENIIGTITGFVKTVNWKGINSRVSKILEERLPVLAEELAAAGITVRAGSNHRSTQNHSTYLYATLPGQREQRVADVKGLSSGHYSPLTGPRLAKVLSQLEALL